jgi:ribosomal protein S18 acetylase RimI-like enzyme
VKEMVKLEPMSEEEFGPWLATHARDYAKDKVVSGAWRAEDAPRLADEAYHKLLPQGLGTPDNFVYTAVDEATEENVGNVWFAKMTYEGQTFAFVYDLLVLEEHRRKGYGEQIMRALEEKVREVGLDSIALHVFGHNHAAKVLYEKIGYEITDLNMMKKL